MAEQRLELSRPVAIDRIGEGPMNFDLVAHEAELGAVAIRMRVPNVSRMVASFRVRRLSDGAFAADGRLEATLTRECVVSLEPFEEHVAEDFALVFVPADLLVETDDPEAPDQIPYEHGAIDLGEVAVEQLALAMDPFPRAPGSSSEAAPSGEQQTGQTVRPFAGLAAKLRGED